MAVGGPAALEAAVLAALPVVRRGEPDVAAERLRELRRLAVADAARDLAHGQAGVAEQRRRALHAHARQVLAEGRVADLGVGALQLAARRRDAARDVVEREVGGELLVHDRDRVLEERRPVVDRRRSVRRHPVAQDDDPTDSVSRWRSGTLSFLRLDPLHTGYAERYDWSSLQTV